MDPKPHLISIFYRTFKLVLRVRMFIGWNSVFVNSQCVEFSWPWIRMHNIWCIIICFIIQVGQEVEFSRYSREKGGKASAEGVKLLAKGSIPLPPCREESLYGKVVRPHGSVNPDQVPYRIKMSSLRQLSLLSFPVCIFPSSFFLHFFFLLWTLPYSFFDVISLFLFLFSSSLILCRFYLHFCPPFIAPLPPTPYSVGGGTNLLLPFSVV